MGSTGSINTRDTCDTCDNGHQEQRTCLKCNGNWCKKCLDNNEDWKIYYDYMCKKCRPKRIKLPKAKCTLCDAESDKYHKLYQCNCGRCLCKICEFTFNPDTCSLCLSLKH